MDVLIVVDVQNDFVTGSLGTKEAQSIIPRIKKKIESYNRSDAIVIFTKDTHGDDYLETAEGKKLSVKHCVKGTEGWELVPALKSEEELNFVICKHTFGYNNWKKFHHNFRYKPNIEMVGLCTDICVVSNALILKALYPECNITVDASCCAGSTPEKHKAALEVMKSCQIDIIGEEAE